MAHTRGSARAALEALSGEDRTWLSQAIFRPAPNAMPARHLAEAELVAAEIWLEERLHEAASPRLKHARTRLWFIFMFLRHAGLRLVEVFSLQGACFDFGRGLLRVPVQDGGDAGREVPLPPDVSRKLGAVWAAWPGREMALPFVCDASRVRRGLRQCALACGLPPEAFNARELRRNRGLELELTGVHPSLVDVFLGREAAEKKSLVRFDADAAKWMLRERIQGHVRTSARNLFRGRVTRVRHNGLLADVTFATAAGLEVRARVTDRSCRSLRLAPGAIVRGAVKALWLEARPADSPPGAAEENRFAGTVEAIRREGGFVEALITLEDGAQACAVRPAGEMAWLGGAGEKAAVVFSPDAVVLSVG